MRVADEVGPRDRKELNLACLRVASAVCARGKAGRKRLESGDRHSRTVRWLALALLPLIASGCFHGGGILGGELQPADLYSTKYGTWRIEVDYAQDNRPSQSLLDQVKGRLQEVAWPSIDFVYDEALQDTKHDWSNSQVISYADAHQGQHTAGSTVVTHLVFLDGTYEGGSVVLGVTNRHDVIAVFPESVRAACSTFQVPPCPYAGNLDQVMFPVLVHEFGHAMGLVNRGTPMVHPHEASTCSASGTATQDQAHSTNKQSVMYCAVETTNVLQAFLGGGIPNDYDSDDKADIQANGGR